MEAENISDEKCKICDGKVNHDFWIYCDIDGDIYGRQCLKWSVKEFNQAARKDRWICPTCEDKNLQPSSQTDNQSTPTAILRESSQNQPENQPGPSTSGTQQSSRRIRVPIEEDEISSEESDTGDEATYSNSQVAHEPTPSRRKKRNDNHSIPHGHYEVKQIVAHRIIGARREFKVRFIDGSEFWLKESDCDRCVKRIMAYCNKVGIQQTRLLQPAGGSSGQNEPVTENWVTAKQVLEKISIYGKADGLQPYLYEKLHPWDSIYLEQIGEHFFAVLYLHERKLALVADGLNSLPDDEEAMSIIQDDFAPAALRVVRFNGQNQDDRCGSAAVAIVIEFQKIYEQNELPSELWPERVTYKRIQAAMHKVDTPIITTWKPITEQKVGVTCPKCGKNFKKAKARSYLNLHNCSIHPSVE